MTTQLGSSHERLLKSAISKAISIAVCRDIFKAVDDYYDMRQYLNLVEPKFPLSSIMESREGYQMVALIRKQVILPESCT